LAPTAPVSLPKLPTALPREALREATLMRICRLAYASSEPAFRNAAVYRFDAPDQTFGTLYAARDFATCFFETVVRNRGSNIPRSEYESHAVATLLVDALQLQLVQLHGDGAKQLGVDLALLASADYSCTQALAKAIYEHPERPHGMIYRSRFDDEALAVVLFDRASAHVRLFPSTAAVALVDVPELADAVRQVWPFTLV
jgi:hypothetical protein